MSDISYDASLTRKDIIEHPLFIYYKIIQPTCICELSAVAPPPSRDFFHCIISADKVTLRSWRITPRQDSSKYRPVERIVDFITFKDDDRMQNEMIQVFGQNTVNYIVDLMDGKIDFLVRMPKAILLRIASFLPLEDIGSLSNVCRQLRQFCNENALWEMLFRRHCPTPITSDMQEVGDLYGWKRLFFTSKLQLQRQIRRYRSQRSSDICSETGQLDIGDFPEVNREEADLLSISEIEADTRTSDDRPHPSELGLLPPSAEHKT